MKNETMREKDISKDWGLRDLQDKMLEILKYIHYFCQENKIEYCLAYGSVLGAVRHGGFIPWDDDADIYMTAEEYKRFRKLFLKAGDREKFYLQEMNAVDGMVSMAKLRMNGTTFIEPLYKDYDMHQGIYVDIFILHYAPNSWWKKHFMNWANQYLVLKGLSNRRYQRKKLLTPVLAFLRLFPYNFLRKYALKILYQYAKKRSKMVFDMDLRQYKRSFYEFGMIFPVHKAAFAGVDLFVPARTEAYLRWVYGDYMTLPEPSEIKRAQHAVIWDIDKDFRKYLPNIYDFSDERKV